MKCQCSQPGFCTEHQRIMSPAFYNLCHNGQAGTSADAYYDAFHKPRPAIEPTEKKQQLPCVHIGPERRLQQCESCGGMVKIRVFSCAVHAETTLGKKVPDVACCQGCTDYSQIEM